MSDDPVVQALPGVRIRSVGEGGDRPLPAGLAHPVGQLPICQQRSDRSREGGLVAGGTKRPVTPSSMTSTSPPLLDATTGRRRAIASSAVMFSDSGPVVGPPPSSRA